MANIAIQGDRNPDKEKRTERRISSQVIVSIKFLSRTESWRPAVQVGHSIDVSLRGTKVFLGELPADIYNRLLKDFRQVQVTFTDPETQETIDLLGQIIWIDYHKEHAQEASGPCYLGVFFDSVQDKDIQRYQQLVDALHRPA